MCSMYVCVCVCVCVCVYEKVINMCIHACMYVCACMHACMHACICMHACTRSISDTKPAIPAISPLLLQAKRERVVYWYSFSNHHRMCSHTIECVLLLESVVYWYSFSNPRTTRKLGSAFTTAKQQTCIFKFTFTTLGKSFTIRALISFRPVPRIEVTEQVPVHTNQSLAQAHM